MRVLWFTNTPAGGEEFLGMHSLTGGWLSSLNHEIKNEVELSIAFYYARFVKPFEHNGVLYYPICKKNWKLRIIKDNLFGGYIDQDDLSTYIEIIEKVTPDIIHIHGTESPFISLLGKTKIPLAVSVQGSSTIYSHKYYSGIEAKYGHQRKIKLSQPITWIFNKSYNHKYKLLLRDKSREIRNVISCKNIIGRTDWDRRITRIMAPESLYYHCGEILRDSFYHHRWKFHDNTRLIVHTTTGENLYKGFETICQALNELNKINIDIEWRVAGISEGSLLNSVVKRKLKSSYPSKGLVLLGSIEEKMLITKMLEADLYVMPSHIENSPNSLCEAMLIGMPCITTLAGGSSSLLTDKKEGLVIQDGDPWAMAGTILELAKDKTQAIKYGKEARIRAIQQHDKERIVMDLLRIYNIIIDNNQ